MDYETKINTLEKLQSKIIYVRNQIESLENDFKLINGHDVNNKLDKQKLILEKMNDIIIDNDNEYLKIRVHKMNIDKLLRCDIYEELKYVVSKIILKYNLN